MQSNTIKKTLFITYSQNKKTIYKGKFIYPIFDCLLLDNKESNLNLSFGDRISDEYHESVNVDVRFSFLGFFLSLFYIDKMYLKDFMTIYRLNNNALSHSDNGDGTTKRNNLKLRILKAFFVSRYLSIKFKPLVSDAAKVYVTQYYNIKMLAIIRACNRVNVPVLDIQHGYCGPEHPAYAEIMACDSTYIPSGFVVFDDNFKKYILQYTKKSIEITNWKHLTCFNDGPKKEGGQKVALYSAQWGTPLTDFVYELLKAYPKVQWIFRIHPLDTAERADVVLLKNYPNANIEFSSQNLATSISNSDVHLTWNSSVAFEAEHLGIPSFYFSKEDIPRFENREVGKNLIFFIDENNFKILDEYLI